MRGSRLLGWAQCALRSPLSSTRFALVAKNPTCTRDTFRYNHNQLSTTEWYIPRTDSLAMYKHASRISGLLLPFASRPPRRRTQPANLNPLAFAAHWAGNSTLAPNPALAQKQHLLRLISLDLSSER